MKKKMQIMRDDIDLKIMFIKSIFRLADFYFLKKILKCICIFEISNIRFVDACNYMQIEVPWL